MQELSTNSVSFAILKLVTGDVIPILSRYKVRILLSYKFILNCLIQFFCELPQIINGCPGVNNKESIGPSINY